MPRPSDSDPRSAFLRAVALFAVAALLLTSCGPPEIDPNARLDADGQPVHNDGLYAAASSHTGPEGWRAFLQVRVHAGLIESICFDAVDASGVRLWDDDRYLEEYRLETGVDLEAHAGRWVEELLDRQAPPPLPEPEARAWAAVFDLLAREALDAAESGITVDAAGIAIVPTAGPYFATDLPDELGWRAELVLVYGPDGVVAGSYREVRRELDGSLRVKRDDADYQALFAEVSGTTSGLVEDQLIEQLVDAGFPAGVDGVSGASLSSARFTALAARIEDGRAEAPLPNRLCR